MKIRVLSRDNEVDVLAVYWAEYQGKREMHFLIVPYDGYEGVIVALESECEITDASLDGFILKKVASGRDILVLGIVLEDDLLDRMIEHDPVAMAIYNEKQAVVS